MKLASRDVQRLLQVHFQSTGQRLEKLLRALIRCTDVPGDIPRRDRPIWPYLIAASYCQSQEEWKYYLQHLNSTGHVKWLSIGDPPVVTLDGFQFIENLDTTNRESRIRFRGMWFSPEVLPLWIVHRTRHNESGL